MDDDVYSESIIQYRSTQNGVLQSVTQVMLRLFSENRHGGDWLKSVLPTSNAVGRHPVSA